MLPCDWFPALLAPQSHARCPRVPMFSRFAIQASGCVVRKRNSSASLRTLTDPFMTPLRHYGCRAPRIPALVCRFAERYPAANSSSRTTVVVWSAA
jgi:hypothetical protein